MQSEECMLCCQSEPFMGLGQCSHGPICYKCSYKMRQISKNIVCPVCKTESKTIIITSELKEFSSINQKKLVNSKQFPGFLFQSDKALTLFEKLIESRCFVPNCDEEKTFSSIALLKKHLKERHSRFFCDICLECKTCVLEEHKLYSSKGLDRHMRRGDLDESGNIVFMHPYCKTQFCNLYMFDQDFLKKHVQKQHFKCTLCPEKYKYYQYKDYKSLETHYRMTHYLCPDPDCLAKCFIAFKKSSDLLAHRYLVHDKKEDKKTADMTAVAGFFTDGSKLQQQQIKFQDKEGVDFEGEYLSLKKTKMRALLDYVDEHKDEEFDFRIFQRQRYDDEDLFEQAFEKPKERREKGGGQAPQGKKKYKLKDNAPREGGAPQKVYRDSVVVARTVNSPLLDYKDFENKLHIIFDQAQYDKFAEMKHAYMKNKLKAIDFITDYLKLFDQQNRITGYNVWAQFIRTVQNQQTRHELDKAYLQALRKLPARVDNLISSSQRYSDFFDKLLSIIEQQIQLRIQSGALNIRKKVKMDKERIFQMIQVIRHIRTPQMARLKFSTNFGISPQTLLLIQSKVYTSPLPQSCTHLTPISQFQLLNLYLFVKFCRNALSGKDIHLEKKFIKEEILEEFLDARPELMAKYGKRKESMTLDEQVEFEKEQEKKTKEKALNRLTGGFMKKQVVIDQDDKYDFPTLGGNKVEKEKVADKSKVQLTTEQFKETFVYQSKKSATLQKNINQLFPTLGNEEKEKPKKQQTSKTEPKVEAVPEPAPVQPPANDEKKKKSNWWAQVDGHDNKPVEEGKIEGQIRREKKKKKEIIYIQGGFK